MIIVSLRPGLTFPRHWHRSLRNQMPGRRGVRDLQNVTGGQGAERLIAQRRVYRGKGGICNATIGVGYGTV